MLYCVEFAFFNRFKFFRLLVHLFFDIKIVLKSQPKFGRIPKITTQANCSIGCYPSVPFNNFNIVRMPVDPFKGYPPLIRISVSDQTPGKIPVLVKIFFHRFRIRLLSFFGLRLK